MLYISTGDRNDTHTAYVALTCDEASDGGLYIPFRIPELTQEDLKRFENLSFNETMAEILNIFFSAKFSGWDMDFCIGKRTLREVSMSHKILVAELWHNPDSSFSHAAEGISRRLLQNVQQDTSSRWFKTALRIAALFATYGQLINCEFFAGNMDFDLVIPADDMIWPVAATIACKMGLPVGTVVCACRDESNIWDLVHKGVFSTAGSSAQLRAGVEAMICLMMGADEAIRFRSSCENRRVYSIEGENPFADRFYCTVAGNNRAENAINSLFRSNQYLIDPVGALCFSGLQDYRAGTGAGRVALLFSECSPLEHSNEVAAATGVSAQKLAQYVRH